MEICRFPFLKEGEELNYNRFIFAGHLTADPELKYTQGGLAIATFVVAINHVWYTAEKEKKTDVAFLNMKCFGTLAETIGSSFTKGMPIFGEGRLTQESWEDANGNKKSAIKVVLEKFNFVGKKSV